MIGYYVHHHGSGHLMRAGVLTRALGELVTGLSSLPRPQDWSGEWVQLERDDVSPTVSQPTAHDRLHWAPLHDPGLRRRTTQISQWIESAVPRLMIVDVSTEVCLLTRLHGVPVVSTVLPGRRGDAAHQLGFEVADVLVAFWPAQAREMLVDVPDNVRAKVRPVGALSRFAGRDSWERRPGAPRVTLLAGAGGDNLTGEQLEQARAQSPHWDWTILSRALGDWTPDPWPAIRDADVVVTHAGQNALAEVAAARRPAVIVPQQRPHDEQVTTSEVLRCGDWPAMVVDHFPDKGWGDRLDHARELDGRLWSRWCDGEAARRFVEVVRAVSPDMRRVS